MVTENALDAFLELLTTIPTELDTIEKSTVPTLLTVDKAANS